MLSIESLRELYNFLKLISQIGIEINQRRHQNLPLQAEIQIDRESFKKIFNSAEHFVTEMSRRCCILAAFYCHP